MQRRSCLCLHRWCLPWCHVCWTLRRLAWTSRHNSGRLSRLPPWWWSSDRSSEPRLPVVWEVSCRCWCWFPCYGMRYPPLSQHPFVSPPSPKNLHEKRLTQQQIIPPYQAEIAHPDIRGRITALQQFMLGIGAFVAGWVSEHAHLLTCNCLGSRIRSLEVKGVNTNGRETQVSYGTFIHLTDSGQWRIPLGLQMIPAVFLALLIFLFPESPRWLIHKDRYDEAFQTLARLHTNGNVDDPWVRAEFDQIRESVAEEKANEAHSYVELFKNQSSFRRLFISCALQASIQMTGVSAIQYYSISIYGQIGISSSDALKYQAINNILALIAQASCILFVDYLGRRRPLIWGNICNGITFVIATILICAPHRPTLLCGKLGEIFLTTERSTIPSRNDHKCGRQLGLHHHVCASCPVSPVSSMGLNLLCRYRAAFADQRYVIPTVGLGSTTFPSLLPVVPSHGLSPPRSSTRTHGPRASLSLL